jgi:hypothetical protein
VQLEAERMDNSGRPRPAAGAPAPAPDVQQQLDQLRQQVASFTKRLEEQA